MKFMILFLLLVFSISVFSQGKGVHQNGYWYGDNISEEHVFDKKLGYALVEFFKDECAASIVDFGCLLNMFCEFG